MLGATLVALGAAGCASKDLEVVTGPDPRQYTPTTEVVIDDPADELGSENGTGTGTNAVAEDSTTSSSSSSTSSTTTTAPREVPDDDEEGSGGTSATTASTTTPPGGAPQAGATAATQSVGFVNARRADNGLGALRDDGELRALAEAWAQQMAADQEMRHNPNLDEQMPDGYFAWGENVAYGFDPAAIDQAWWDSEGHRANMLNGDYTAIGVAFVEDDAGDLWAVQVYGGD